MRKYIGCYPKKAGKHDLPYFTHFKEELEVNGLCNVYDPQTCGDDVKRLCGGCSTVEITIKDMGE